MRQIAFILYGIVLLALDGAICRIFHLEWIRPDPVLILVVFVALHMPATEGAAAVFMLGIFADSFAGTPTGMLATAHLLAWFLVRWSRQFLVPGQRSIQLGILFCITLVFNLLLILLLAVMGASSGPIWICLKAMLPLAVVHVILAVPVWGLARRIRRPVSQPRTLGVF